MNIVFDIKDHPQPKAGSNGMLLVNEKAAKLSVDADPATKISINWSEDLPACPEGAQTGVIYAVAIYSARIQHPAPKIDPADVRTGAVQSFTISWSYRCKKTNGCCVIDNGFQATISTKEDPDANLPVQLPKQGE